MVKKICLFSFWIQVFAVQCPAGQPLYLERELHAALQSRDNCYKQLQVMELLFPFPDNTDAVEDSLRLKLSAASPDSSSQWFYFLHGLSCAGHAADSQARFFSSALQAAGNNPANIWTLSMEFGRCRQRQWETRCFEKLYKLFLIAGVSDARIITGPLIAKATEAEKNKDKAVRNAYYAWADKFGAPLLWPSVQRIVGSFPAQLSVVMDESARLIARIGASWRLQAFLALHALLWLRWLLTFMITAVLIVMGIRSLPLGLHRIAEMLPGGMAQPVKLYCASVLFASLFSFGLLPGLWLLIVCVWKFSSYRDKWLLGIAAMGLLMYPFSVRMEDMLRQCQSPSNTPALFYRASDDGVSPDVESFIHTYALTHPDDYLAFTAAAIYATKLNDAASASLAAGRARTLRGNDPVVLMTDGMISYYCGNFEQAKNAFETCTKLYPDYAPAFFNYGQCFLASNETFKGMDYIDRATKINQSTINSFIKINDDLFSKNWPRMRQLMKPEYLGAFFWRNVFPRYWGTFSAANALWGNVFLGLPMELYCIIGVIILGTLLVLNGFVWSSIGARTIFLCKLCQAPMCRRCKKGMVCTACFHAVQPIRNENIRQRIIEKILLKNRKIALWSASCLDVVFPGTGMLYSRNGTLAPALLFIGLTSCIYATLAMLHAMIPLCACLASNGAEIPVLYILALYTLLFAVRAYATLKKEMRS